MSEEIWKPVCGYETRYEISTRGRIRRIKASPGTTVGKILRPAISNCGYLRVALRNGKTQSKHSIHRLVAEVFVPNPDDKPHVNHKNGIKHDNRPENLEWVTSSENAIHAFNLGLRSATIVHLRGEMNGQSRFTESDVLEIRRLYRLGGKQRDIAKQFNTGKTTIAHIVNYDYWKHVP